VRPHRRPKQAQNRLTLLRAVSDDMAALMQQETVEWVLEFQSNLLRWRPRPAAPGARLAAAPRRPRGRRVAGPGRGGLARPAGDPAGREGDQGRRLARMVGAENPAARGDPRPMPTDHGPELEALRKRLADAKEFL
jgi:hypothetical protein